MTARRPTAELETDAAIHRRAAELLGEVVAPALGLGAASESQAGACGDLRLHPVYPAAP